MILVYCDTMFECEICEDLWERLAVPGASNEVNFGSFEEALKSPCGRHLPLIEAFEKHCTSSRSKLIASKSKDVGIRKGPGGRGASLSESISNLGVFWELVLVQRSDVEGHTGTGRQLDPDWIDLRIVKQWKQMCLSSHDKKCENPMKLPATSPAWLVDVEKRCIVPGTVSATYVALSYRWGNAVGYRLRAETLDRLCQPGVLSNPEMVDQIPLTVRNAIDFVPLLGERYLWVDMLCVLTGSHASTAIQLKLMSAIYANAILTIIAADGDASDGLLGIEGVSASRQFKQKIIPFGDERILVRNTGIFSMDTGTPYYDRAWPYQEYKMSPRKLLFNRKEVHFECQESVWHEELTLGTEMSKYIDPRLKVILAGFQDMDSLSHILCKYNTKQLTYDEDALAGIDGLLTVASRSFAGGFLYGLPEMLFDRALGWRPIWPHVNLRRRQRSARPMSSRVSDSALPSWSWVGWEGLTWWRYGEASRINDRTSTIEETIPITEWYTSNDPHSKYPRRIRSTWFENREHHKDDSQPLPEGWSRHEASQTGTFREEPRLYPDGCGKYVYTHKNMPDSDCPMFYYPFPVADIGSDTPFHNVEQTSYLFCKTMKSSVWAERRQGGTGLNSAEHIAKSLLLRTKEGGEEEIGSLQLHTEEQLTHWPKLDSGAAGAKGRMVELVAIYRTVKYQKTFNKDLQRYVEPMVRSELYNVLWLEWIEGIAYRLAIGEIDRDVWDGLASEKVDLVLG